MGVIQLWSILAPVKKPVPLSDLKGQTLAVDLSIWVCESNAVRQMQGVVLKPHLRNLFFRVSNLTQMGIKLIFVIDGQAPDLKQDTMAKRQQTRHLGKHKATSSLSNCKRKGRSQFNTILKECCELLNHLGVPYIYSEGEAEALCAMLNHQGIANGCLTEDGDAFLYGAKTVYRNFTLNTKDPHVESYSGEDIEKNLGLRQESLVGLALLLGCDYLPKGVPGVGKEQVLKLVKSLEGVNILHRFEAWQTEGGSNLEGIEKSVWKKAMKVENFPNQEVISEFLVAKDTCAGKEFRQRRPWIEKLQDFLLQKLDWPREYTEEKVLPLVTLWDMTDILLTGQHKPTLHLEPHRIVKRRVRQGVPCLEVEWMRQDNATEDNPYYTTIEEEEKFTLCFSETVELFEDMEKAKKASKGRKKVKADKAHSRAPPEEDDVVSMVTKGLNNLDLNTKMSEVIISGDPDKVNCWNNDDKLLSTAISSVTSVGNEDIALRRKNLKHNAQINQVNSEEIPAILNDKVKTTKKTSSTLSELSVKESGSSDDDNLSEYIPLSLRIKMGAMKDSGVKDKKIQRENHTKPEQNKPNFLTQKKNPGPEHEVELKTCTRPDNGGKGTKHWLFEQHEHSSETSSSVAVEDHNLVSIINRGTTIIISTTGGENSDRPLSTPAQKLGKCVSERVDDFSLLDTGKDSTYKLPNPDGATLLNVLRNDDDNVLGTAGGDDLVTSKVVRTVNMKSDTCVPDDPSGTQSDVHPRSPAGDQAAALDQSLPCTYDDSIDLFDSESMCASPQITDNKLFTNQGYPFSSPNLSSGQPRIPSPSFSQTYHGQGNSLRDDLLQSSPCLPPDLWGMKTPHVPFVKHTTRLPFDSPNMIGTSPGYGYFILETSLLNNTTEPHVRDPLTPITCNIKVKVDGRRIECQHENAECFNIGDVLETPDKTAGMLVPEVASRVDCGKELKKIVNNVSSPADEMYVPPIGTSQNLKSEKLSQGCEGFDFSKDILRTKNVFSGVSSKVSVSHQPMLADNSNRSSNCKQFSSGKENMLTRKIKKQHESTSSLESTSKSQDVDDVNICIDKITKLRVKENVSDLNLASPLALADRLKTKFASLSTNTISGETVVSVKKITQSQN